ncbi:MAG: hypothetical protein E6Q29_12525, partial [Alicycliphilus sp.]
WRPFLPLPRAGEGRGEGVKTGPCAASPPHPNRLPQGGEGAKTCAKYALRAIKKMSAYTNQRGGKKTNAPRRC